MNSFCSNCGNQLNPYDTQCSRCGAPVFQQPVYPQPMAPVYIVKQKTPGKGFGITSMIMGILGLVYTFSFFSFFIEAIDRTYYYRRHFSQLMSMIFSFGFVVAIFDILAIIFAICALSRGYKKGMAKSGLVMGIISLGIIIILSMVMILNSY